MVDRCVSEEVDGSRNVCGMEGRTIALWHVHHHNPLRHKDEVGRVRLGKYDDAKFLGFYSTQEIASKAIDNYRKQPGFELEPHCFIVEAMKIDVDLI